MEQRKLDPFVGIDLELYYKGWFDGAAVLYG
jgi:hypothetical protein